MSKADALVGKKVRHKIETDYIGTVVEKWVGKSESHTALLSGHVWVEWEPHAPDHPPFRSLHHPDDLEVIE